MDGNLTAVGDALQGFGAVAGNIAGAIYLQDVQAQQLSQALEGKAVLADLYKKPLIATRDMPYDPNDPDAYKRTVDEAAKQAKAYIDTIQDSTVKNHLMTGDLSFRNAALDHVNTLAYSRKREWQQGAVQKGRQMLEQETIDASPDLTTGETLPAVWDRKMREFNLTIDQAARTGILTAEQADAHHREYLKQVAVGLMQKDPKQAGLFLESYKPYFEPTVYAALHGELQKVAADSNEQAAYNAIGILAAGDMKKAAVMALSPESGKTFGLSLNQQQNIAQSFNAMYAAAEVQKKDAQEKNIGELYILATTNPSKALRAAETVARNNPGAYDAKDLLSFKNATENHIRQLSLMSQQERQIRIDLEDKGKAAIKQNILQGLYTDEKKLMTDIMAGGFSNTSEFMTQAVSLLRNERKNYGEVNQFKLASDDWNRLIGLTKEKSKKKEMSDQSSQIMETLTNWAQTNGVKTSDPAVYKKYQEIKASVTATWFTRMLDNVTGGKAPASGSGDTFARPKAAPAATYPVNTTRRNIRTNARERWDGTKWQPMSGS